MLFENDVLVYAGLSAYPEKECHGKDPLYFEQLERLTLAWIQDAPDHEIFRYYTKQYHGLLHAECITNTTLLHVRSVRHVWRVNAELQEKYPDLRGIARHPEHNIPSHDSGDALPWIHFDPLLEERQIWMKLYTEEPAELIEHLYLLAHDGQGRYQRSERKPLRTEKIPEIENDGLFRRILRVIRKK